MADHILAKGGKSDPWGHFRKTAQGVHSPRIGYFFLFLRDNLLSASPCAQGDPDLGQISPPLPPPQQSPTALKKLGTLLTVVGPFLASSLCKEQHFGEVGASHPLPGAAPRESDSALGIAARGRGIL